MPPLLDAAVRGTLVALLLLALRLIHDRPKFHALLVDRVLPQTGPRPASR